MCIKYFRVGADPAAATRRYSPLGPADAFLTDQRGVRCRGHSAPARAAPALPRSRPPHMALTPLQAEATPTGCHFRQESRRRLVSSTDKLRTHELNMDITLKRVMLGSYPHFFY